MITFQEMTVKINNNNPSAVRTWIDEQIKSKRFKRCAHLLLVSQRVRAGSPAGPHTQIYFMPHCERASFDWGRYGSPDLEMQRELLCLYAEFDQISCPKGCRFYRHAWVGRLLGFVPACLRWFKDFLRPAFQWFAKLKGITQVFLILML